MNGPEIMQHFVFRNGLAAPPSQPAGQETEKELPVSSVAIFGSDYPGSKWTVNVKEGDRVSCGDAVLRDRHDHRICVVSPSAGTITAIERGARRTIARVVMEVDQNVELPFDCELLKDEPGSDRAAVLAFLLRAGLWPALRTRPFDLVAAPDGTAAEIFVNACHPTGNSPNPALMYQHEFRWFSRGLEALGIMAGKSVHVCQSSEIPFYEGSDPKINCVRFSGAYCASLTSTHVHAVKNRSSNAAVWTIGWQDVLAIGQMLVSGTVSWQRKIVVGGDAAKTRSSSRTPVGSSLRDLSSGNVHHPSGKTPVTVLSGDPIAGAVSSHLRRFDDVATLSVGEVDAAIAHGSEPVRPIIPKNRLLNALPFGKPSLPIMRALLSNDFETAHRLGADWMVEADVAQLTRQCASGADYGVLLRRALNSYAGQPA